MFEICYYDKIICCLLKIGRDMTLTRLCSGSGEVSRDIFSFILKAQFTWLSTKDMVSKLVFFSNLITLIAVIYIFASWSIGRLWFSSAHAQLGAQINIFEVEALTLALMEKSSAQLSAQLKIWCKIQQIWKEWVIIFQQFYCQNDKTKRVTHFTAKINNF